MALEKNSSKEKISREMPMEMPSGKVPVKRRTGKMPERPPSPPPQKKKG